MPQLSEFEKKSYYELLGVEPTATLAEIKEAYREIARVYHPDSNFFDDLVDTSLSDSDNQIFRMVTAAYNTLIKESDRKAYDAKLNGGPFSTTTDGNETNSRTQPRNTDYIKSHPRSQFGKIKEQPDTPGGTPYCRFGQQAKFQAEAAAEEAAAREHARKRRINLAIFGAAVILVAVAIGLSYLVLK